MSNTHIITDEKKVDALLTRGVSEVIVAQELRKKLLSGKKLRIKLGVDPTSPDIHLGRATVLWKMRDFQELGHQLVLIVGDFTAVVGDTSDKDAERPMLSRDTIEHNKKTYFQQMGKIIDLSKTETLYNSQWLEPLTYREIGEHADMFSVSDFISRENIKKRLDSGKRVSLREVLYPLMQGYDSVAVRADVELGGTDQKFNLLAGRAMQEKSGQEPQSILTVPLINGLDGRKMSSSWGNTIVLTTQAADMYGKVMSMRDEEIITYFETCTRVSLVEVAEISNGLQQRLLHPKEVKMRLAREIVTLYHSVDAAQKAEEEFNAVFSGGGIPENTPKIRVHSGAKLRDVATTVAGSTSELRRLVDAGAVSEVGSEPFTSIDALIKHSMVIRIGKHRFVDIVLE